MCSQKNPHLSLTLTSNLFKQPGGQLPDDEAPAMLSPAGDDAETAHEQENSTVRSSFDGIQHLPRQQQQTGDEQEQSLLYSNADHKAHCQVQQQQQQQRFECESAVKEATTRASTRSRSPWHRESKQASTKERIVGRGVQQHEKEKETNKKAEENEEQPALYTDVDHTDSSPKEIEKERETTLKLKTKVGENTSEKKMSKSEKFAEKQHFEKTKAEVSKCSAASRVIPAAHDSAESEVCWKEERRVPRTGLKGSCVLTQAGRESLYFVVTFSDYMVCTYAYSMSIYMYIFCVYTKLDFCVQARDIYVHTCRRTAFIQTTSMHTCIQTAYVYT